jgi:FkbM family methyltransferase
MRRSFIYDNLIKAERTLSASSFGRKLKKIRMAATLYGKLYQRFRPSGSVMTTSWGHRLHVDPGDLGIARCLLVYNGVWEPLETETFVSVLRKGMVVADIGANVGYYTLLAARSVGSAGKVFAFEPEPKNYELLCRNIKENGYTNVVTVPSAVSDRNGTSRLYLSANNFGAHNLSTRSPDAKFVNIDTVSLDEFFSNYQGRIDVLKIDAEGAEELIFDGMSQLLRRHPNLILFTEFHPRAMEGLGSSPERYIEKLSAHGFRVLQLLEHEHRLREIELDQLSALTRSLRDSGIPESHADLVCVRGECNELAASLDRVSQKAVI